MIDQEPAGEDPSYHILDGCEVRTTVVLWQQGRAARVLTEASEHGRLVHSQLFDSEADALLRHQLLVRQIRAQHRLHPDRLELPLAVGRGHSRRRQGGHAVEAVALS